MSRVDRGGSVSALVATTAAVSSVVPNTPLVAMFAPRIVDSLSDDFKQSLYDSIEAYLATEEGKAAFDEVYEWSAITTAEDSEFDIVRDAVDKLGLTE